MPHFHIHLYNHTGESLDEDGADMPALAVAEQKAVQGIRSILSEEVAQGSLDLRGHADIATPSGRVLQTVRFADVLVIHPEE